MGKNWLSNPVLEFGLLQLEHRNSYQFLVVKKLLLECLSSAHETFCIFLLGLAP
jgi:hypothetical protein